MLGLGENRKILRIYLQCGLFIAGPHATWPRYPRRLRPAEIGDRKIVGARAPGAARDGDDGLIGWMSALRRILKILGALAAGHFVMVNVLLAGKVLSDVTNLYHYSSGGSVVGYIVMVFFSTAEFFLLSLVPAAIILVFTETLRVRSPWFYMTLAGLGSALLDVACTS